MKLALSIAVLVAFSVAASAAPVKLSKAQMDNVVAGATPDQGSGKNGGGNVVGPFAGNPHDRPGANAK